MIARVAERFKKRYLAVDMFDNYLKVIDSKTGVLIYEELTQLYYSYYNEELPDNYRYDSGALEKILRLVVNRVGDSFFSPILLIVIPYEFSLARLQNLVGICNTIRFKGYFITNLQLLVNEEDPIEQIRRGRIAIYSICDRTYIGYIFAGTVNYVECINKPISEIDQRELDSLIANVKSQKEEHLPQQYYEVKISNADLKRLENIWNQSDANEEIFMYIYPELWGQFGDKITYSDCNLVIEKAMVVTLDVIKSKKLRMVKK